MKFKSPSAKQTYWFKYCLTNKLAKYFFYKYYVKVRNKRGISQKAKNLGYKNVNEYVEHQLIQDHNNASYFSRFLK